MQYKKSMAEKELSQVEAELYDRQIRLWGIESQTKLRAANILLIGIRALGSEIAKDILLSGINSLTILDDKIVTQEDLLNNFLLSQDSIGKNIAEASLIKAQALNPMVQVTIDKSSVKDKEDTFFNKFTIVVATGLPTEQLIFINQACRGNETQFICGDVFGFFGYSFSDLQIHEYYEDRVQHNKGKKRSHDGKVEKSEKVTVRVKGDMTYVPLQDALGVDWTTDDQKKSNKYSELYYLFRVLLLFRNTQQRNPSIKEKAADIQKLNEIRDTLLKSLAVVPNKVSDSLFDLIFGDVVPICSIVGGIIAQEVIKAVSHKGVPINNLFLLDPRTYNGKEETIC